MKEQNSNSLYEEWPEDEAARHEIARDIFGQHIVASEKSRSKIANDMLNEGYRYNSPTPEQTQSLDWIATLDENGRAQASAFARHMMHGVVFSVLNSFDGTSRSVLHETHHERLRISLERLPRDAEHDADAMDSVIVSSIGGNYELHEELFVWEEKYG